MNKLKDYCINITDGEHGSVQDDENGTYYLLSNKNIIDSKIVISENDRRISEKDYLRINKRTKLEQGDVVIATVGTIGKTAVLYNPNNFVFQRSVGIIKTKKEKLDPYYLKYYIDVPSFQMRLQNLSKGAVQKCLFINDIKELEVNIPSIEEQKKVCEVLKCLDAKIENNNNTIFILESMAKTIYDYWFLQFDFPNDEGKPYKSSGGNMVWNDELKREIPEKWNVKKIKDCVQHINTGLNPRNHFSLNEGGNVKYITVKNLTTTGIIDFSGCDKITKEVKQIINKRSMIEKGDILFASIAPLGRCFLMYETPEDWEINESVFAIRPNYRVVNSEYLYMFFMSDWFIKKSEHASTGSIFSGIRISTLEDTYIIVPPKSVLDSFKIIVESLYRMKFNNNKQNQELASLRDFLLPMLMNGQVTFKD